MIEMVVYVDVVLLGISYVEKDGIFINIEWCV